MTLLAPLGLSSGPLGPLAGAANAHGSAAASTSLGGPARVSPAELTAILRTLERVRVRLTFWFCISSDHDGMEHKCDQRGRYLAPVLRDSRWKVVSYRSYTTPGRNGRTSFNVLEYQALDGRTYRWRVDDGFGRAVIEPLGPVRPFGWYPMRGGRTFYAYGYSEENR